MHSSPLRRRGLIAVAGLVGAVAAAGLFRVRPARAAEGPGSYLPDWPSVDQHPPAPEWFQDAKFGVYFHWGVFSVPAYGNEWYPRNMYFDGSPENDHHRAVYGDPAEWPYHNFINGARDKAGNWVRFAPKLRLAGGKFDPKEWAQLFADAGAKFAGPVAEHHDGYSMWDSKANEWNSVATGPRLNLLKLHTDAIRAKGLKVLIAMHHAYNYNGFYERVPAQPTASLRKLYGQLGAAAQNQLWVDKLREVVDGYQPDILWQDFKMDAVAEPARLEFLAHYFNQGAAWNKEVVTTYKDGFNDRSSVFDFERGGPADLHRPYWLTDDSISSSSWCYTQGIGYYPLNAMVHSLIDRVSKNGNMLLNIAPMADGTIPAGQRAILLGIGDYLRRFGESIYSTRAWTVYGEGPTQMGGGAFVEPREGTNRDIRFTRSKNNRVLYATVLGRPGNTLTINTLNANRINLGTLRSAQLMTQRGCTALQWTQDGAGLHLGMPANPPLQAPAYVVKLTFAGPIPTLGGSSVPTD